MGFLRTRYLLMLFLFFCFFHISFFSMFRTKTEKITKERVATLIKILKKDQLGCRSYFLQDELVYDFLHTIKNKNFGNLYEQYNGNSGCYDLFYVSYASERTLEEALRDVVKDKVYPIKRSVGDEHDHKALLRFYCLRFFAQLLNPESCYKKNTLGEFIAMERVKCHHGEIDQSVYKTDQEIDEELKRIKNEINVILEKSEAVLSKKTLKRSKAINFQIS